MPDTKPPYAQFILPSNFIGGFIVSVLCFDRVRLRESARTALPKSSASVIKANQQMLRLEQVIVCLATKMPR